MWQHEAHLSIYYSSFGTIQEALDYAPRHTFTYIVRRTGYRKYSKKFESRRLNFNRRAKSVHL